jgi:hypothetical protein
VVCCYASFYRLFFFPLFYLPTDKENHIAEVTASLLGLTGFFCAIGHKNAGNEQQNARRERLFIRKSALSAIFCCGFGAGKYYLM